MRTLINTAVFIIRHPLNKDNKLSALRRFISWQIGSRLVPGAVAAPFVDSTKLLIDRGMTGATGNLYCGLHEFEDMSFVIKSLRKGDLFVDIGANVGSYTILASGVAGAHSISIEPHPVAFRKLTNNIRLNSLESLVSAQEHAIGATPSILRFTSDLDTVNHVVSSSGHSGEIIEVPVLPLDALLHERQPTVIKIDVEGFETEVLNGGKKTFSSPTLLAVIMELNGSGQRYGYDEDAIHRRMLEWGFETATYTPLERTLTATQTRRKTTGNTLYVRDIDALRERIYAAPFYTVLGKAI